MIRNIVLIVLLIVLIAITQSMKIDGNDKLRNKTIVKVLAAYSNQGIVFNYQAGEYVYNSQVSFVQCFREFLKVYLTLPYTPDRGQGKPIEQAFLTHRREVRAIQDKLRLSKEDISPDEQNQLASEFLGELDNLFTKIYNFTTDNPDKYICLGVPNLLGLLEVHLVKYRKVLGQKAISEMPFTYQYFVKRLRQSTSQFDQDGIIEGIFDLIKTRNKVFVEVGGGSKQDNTYYLRSAMGWKGYLLNSGRYFMGEDKNNKQYLVDVLVTSGNVLKTFRENKVPREFDFLSVDIDGNDYWVTKELLKEYRPAVISVQFNSNFPGDIAATIKNCQPKFAWQGNKQYGVSARAIYELVVAHGYSYVFHLSFTDIFFVRSQLLPHQFRGMKLEETYDAFPLHTLDLNLAEMSGRNLLEQGQADCQSQVFLSSEEIRQQISQEVEKEVSQKIKNIDSKNKADVAKMRKDLDDYKEKYSQLENKIEEQRKEGERVSKVVEEQRKEGQKVSKVEGGSDDGNQGWALLLGIMIGFLVNLAVSQYRKRREPSQSGGRMPQDTNQTMQRTDQLEQ